MKIEPGQRAAFLEEACAGDEELQREVESLLAFEQRAESFIEAPPATALEEAALGLAADPSSAPLTGDIGHYQIVSRLGEGGMGVVYKARDKNLGRSVALKVLLGRIGDGSRAQKAVGAGGQAASALNDPNIITIHDIASQNGIDFIVMEYVAGKTLDALVPRKGTATQRDTQARRPDGGGLTAAHAAGIVHRDLKPAQRDGERNWPGEGTRLRSGQAH